MVALAWSSARVIALRTLAVALTLSSVAAHGSAAQAARVIPLKPADAKLAEEFTNIDYVRELADRRVLVVDAREPRLVVANFASGAIAPVSRSGNGPGEFRSIDGLFALAADSTLLVDDGNRRWLLLNGSRIVATLPPDAPAVVAAQRGEHGADRTGHLLLQLSGGRMPGDQTGRLDSLYVARLDRRTAKADTVTRIRPALRRQVAATRGADGQLLSARFRFAPFVPFEQVVIFPDGWIAIARLDPYRVDWREPNGKWILGANLPVPVIKLDDREKLAYMARTSAGHGVPADPGTLSDWPETIPPFNSLALAAPDGRLLVSRTRTAQHEDTRYDVIDRRGTLVGQIELPKSETIVGFGAQSVFVVVTDDDGIQRLRRHPWP